MKSEIERVPTGIPGLDEMIQGGLEKNSTVLVIGGCGSGKSTLCLQFVYHGALNNEPGLYVTFEENPERMKRHYRQFGWDLEKLESDGKLKIMKIEPTDVLKMIKENFGGIVTAIDKYKAKRIVIDSISSLESMISDGYERKQDMIKLCDWLAKKNCTSMLVSESEETISEYTRHGIMEFIVDGVVVMYNIQKGNVRESALEVLKMRGTKHVKKIVPFTIDRGIEVFPHEEVFGDLKGVD